MTPEMSPAQSSRAMTAPGFAAEPPHADDDDVALGWECANPALQIDAWRHEAAAEALN